MTPCGNPLERAGNRYRPEKGQNVLFTFIYVMVRLKNMDATKNTVTDSNRVKGLNLRAKIYSPGITGATHHCLSPLVNLSVVSTGRISSVLTPRLRTGKARGREQKLILGDTQPVLSDAQWSDDPGQSNLRWLVFRQRFRTRGECQYN